MAEKPLSVEEEQMLVLEFFHESEKHFTLSELAEILPKKTGINADSVEKVVFKLVEQRLVDHEEINTTPIFKISPVLDQNNMKRNLEGLTTEVDETPKKSKLGNENVEEKKEAEQEIKEEDVDYVALLKELTMERDGLMERVKKYEDLEAQKKKTEELKAAANRWTANVFALKKWVKEKYPYSDTDLNEFFQIPPDFDYVE